MTRRHRFLALLAALPATFATEAVFGGDADEAPLGEAVERHLVEDQLFINWVQDPDRLESEDGDRIETREVMGKELETIKLSNVVPPIRFESGVAEIPPSTVASLGAILERMRDRNNVRVHLIGHADDRPLSPALAEIYGDNAGLSRERAGQVAEHLQTELALPAEAISYAWAGDGRPVATNLTESGRALNRRVEVEVWYDEVADRVELEEFLVPHEIRQVKVCRMETVCKLRYVEGHARRAKVQNLVAPLHFDTETIDIDERFLTSVRQGFANLADKQNVVVRFVGYTDDAALTGRAERIYGDHIGLSKAHARRVALAVQDELNLPTSRILSDGRGSERPLGSNATVRGRALNRRVEVEFWYDDPLQDLPDEPQLCPGDAGAEMVTRVYDPPWGMPAPIDIVNGSPAIPAGYTEQLARALAAVSDKTRPRLRFVGYTRNESLARRTAAVYEDDVGLSASRARRAMESVAGQMQLEPEQSEFEGRGFVHADDVVNAGFVQGEESYVAVQVVYDELAILDDYDGVDITRITRELKPKNPLALNLMRITVDGEPIDDPGRSSSDIQRCTDVAFEGADITFSFDNMRSAPRLSVAAAPEYVKLPSGGLGSRETDPVRFRMYTNYAYFIERAEIRIFENTQSIEGRPLAVIDVNDDGTAEWYPNVDWFRAPSYELAYVLRAYGDDGNFDETRARPLWALYADPGEADESGDEAGEPETFATDWSAYGENLLSVHNIGLSSGTVSVRGQVDPDADSVWVAGRPIPLADDGSFISEDILPQGAHTVEVAVLDEEGAGELYLRDLEFVENDWFYVGMADVTVSEGSVNGPADLLQGENTTRDIDSNVDGRLAFFVNGKWGEHWKLTASADTREGPLEDLFSNLMDKSPDALFRRIDPDYHLPTFGDDSVVQEMAPTMGKFFARVSRGEQSATFGNFNVGYMNNELARVDRGLYGGNLHLQSESTTSFGELRFAVDGFAAEPGTVASREEFRGTGGSLYFLNRQDILQGSERVRIEVRDKASGIVTGVVNLQPALDYDIDYLQGRVLLSEPLASTVDDGLLVRSNALGGDEAYLVVRYEYTPGFDDIDAVAVGGQAHAWIGEYVKLGVTSNVNEQDGSDNSVNAADVTVRYAANSWLKLQQAESEGLVSLPQFSTDGGFEFTTFDPAAFVNAQAGASRADISLSSREIVDWGDAQMTFYVQDVEAGYSAPGMVALTDTRTTGGTLHVPLGDRFRFGAKLDNRVQDQGLELRAQEFNLGYRLSERWDVSTGVRSDERSDNSPLVLLTQEQGKRSDAVVQVGFDSKADWSAYGFVQDTLSVTGDRQENGRVGVGGSYQVHERLRVDAEVSDGDLGTGGRIGSNYLHSERTSLYLSYALENERNALNRQTGQGPQGNLVAGMKSRLGDSTSVFLEERYQHSTTMTGLTHGTGISFAPGQSWNLGLSTDIGTLQDVETGAETDRMAAGIQFGINRAKLSLSSGVEYRNDDVENPDLSRSERSTWLFRSNAKYQFSDSSRLLGKLNHSESESSEGAFFDGGYTEAVLGYAYRPVHNDRLNTLAKYTYFYNVPTTSQFGLQNVASEFVQKSHVASIDVTYDITARFSLGGKYAYRLGQISIDREDLDFFDNPASLMVLRGDYRLGQNWEFLAEARLLDMPDLNESRAGMLATVSRYIGDHLKVGLGYNFTDFSDDLTDLSFDHQGVFLNLTGTM